MVKRSKGKSIRGAKWFGQEQVFSETRGKPAEWDTTKGTKLIIPIYACHKKWHKKRGPINQDAGSMINFCQGYCWWPLYLNMDGVE